MNIDEKIKKLSEKKQRRLKVSLIYVVTVPDWCKDNGLNPSNPDRKKVKEILYHKMYE